MKTEMRIKRFNVIDRAFHLALMLTFLLQTATGFSRLYNGTVWGRKVGAVFGGYENALSIHQWVGVVMIVGFILHTAYLFTRINLRAPWKSLFGETSLLPNLNDFRQFGQQVRWFFGLGPAPRFNRWTYWEKFDYWAVYWGMPLLAVTGLMLMYPLTTCDFLPGWSLNIAALLHRAEAVLAAAYIFIVHFFVGHLRPSSFPMNEAMFAGSVPLEEAAREKPAWVARLRSEEAVHDQGPAPPKRWYRVAYFVFGYAALSCGVYFLINGLLYARYISLH